tara:strand:+ start:951 stop:1139 length:189 start_codon:yes stop_codon:yes gene_type:complete
MKNLGFGLVGLLITIAIIVGMAVVVLKTTNSVDAPVNTKEERQSIIDDARDVADVLEKRDSF